MLKNEFARGIPEHCKWQLDWEPLGYLCQMI